MAFSKLFHMYLFNFLQQSDAMTKMFLDPVKVIHLTLHRSGPVKFDSEESLQQDTAATVENGKLNYLGIPRRFLQIDDNWKLLFVQHNLLSWK